MDLDCTSRSRFLGEFSEANISSIIMGLKNDEMTIYKIFYTTKQIINIINILPDDKTSLPTMLQIGG